jgi:outer membrane receptor protein involved in Fe transport
MKGRFWLVVAMVLVTALPLFSQTETTTGSINGVVTDNTGAALPGVTVEATNTQTGLNRSVVTEGDGTYTIPLLPPGTYRVSAALEGLGNAQKDSATVLLGTATKVDLSIRPQVSETITVTADTPVVDTTESASSEAVTQNEIENLPILGRDFKDLVLLTPGVATAFGGRVSLVGARGTAVDYNIDGANANSDFFAEERGGTAAPYVFSQAAIREFQVIRNTYSAEYARGGGGTMNAVTKSGTNDIEGEVFFYHRDEEWADQREGENFDEFFEPRNADQYGFALGGPIMRDRLFYFLNADFQKISEPFNSTDFRTSSTFAALPADVQTSVVSRLEQLTGHSLDEEFRYDTREDQQTWLAKADFNSGSNHHFNVRWNYSDFNNFPSESSGTLSNQGDEYNTVNSYVGQADSVFSPNLYNFALVQYSVEERPINPLGSFPSVTIGGLAQSGNVFFGQRDFLPNRTDEEKWEIKDTLTYSLGDHQIKGGFNYLTVDILNLFARNRAGNFTFQNPAQFLAGTPSQFQQGFGPRPATTFDFQQWGAFVMDTWRPTPKLTLDLGLRYDFMSMPPPVTNVYEAVAPELDDNFVEDTDNFAPRLGFAYDLMGNGNSVLRGGVGKYYTPMPGILLANPISQISGNFNNYVVNCLANPKVPCPTFPNLYTPEQIAQLDPAGIELATVSSDFESGESLRASLGYQQRLFGSYSVEVDGIWAKHEKQQRFVHVNNVPTGLTFGGLTQYTATSANRPYPTLGDILQHVSDAEASYKGVTFGVRKLAFADSRLSWLAHYTWSEAIDQDTNSRSTSTSFHYDPRNPEISEGPSDNDVTHRIVASATYELPLGFMVSGIFNWRTGQPYTRNVFAGSSSTVNPLVGIRRIGINVPVWVDGNGDVIDITAANNSTPAEFAAFLAARDAQLLGRNTENQPDFMNLDMRLSKRFGLPYGMGIELIGEIFNVFNTSNKFITTNNQNEFSLSTTGTGSNLRYRITRNANYGIENGLDFNSPPRQYQAAIKLNF